MNSNHQETTFKPTAISLCICTMNRPEELNHCLHSIFEGVDLPEEIIVSDDSINPSLTKAIVANYPEVDYQQGPQTGLGANRNACIQKAKGNYLIFIDDDVVVTADFFRVARQLINTSKPQTLITGYELNHGGGGRWPGEIIKVVPHNIDFWGLQRVNVTQEYRAIVINATIFPRSLFNQALFDENLRYGCDEIDIAQHAKSLGYQIVYQDNFYVEHHPSPINRDQYQPFIHASRLYTTTKAYWLYERSVLKTLSYIFLAPLQLIGSAIKQKDLLGVWGAIKATILASRYFLNQSNSTTLSN